MGCNMLNAYHQDKKSKAEHTSNKSGNSLSMTYTERAQHARNTMAAMLFNIMDVKKTNLCVAADVTSAAELLRLADEIGPHICMLKLHIDMIKDFTPELTKLLLHLATKHNFLLFEDRKFADIGNTVKEQYEGGVYTIAKWAHVINAHSMPGKGVIQGLQSVPGVSKVRGLLLIAQMSSEGNLCTEEYSKKTVEMAEQFPDFVMGFISQKNVSNDPGMLHCVPGVQFASKGDALGQKYRGPSEAIAEGADIIIVGRGVIKPNDNKTPAEAAWNYRQVGWAAYLLRTSTLDANNQSNNTNVSNTQKFQFT